MSNQQETSQPGLENFLTEEKACLFLGVNKKTLDGLRYNSGLPYVKLNQTNRIYYESDLIEWLLKRRKNNR